MKVRKTDHERAQRHNGTITQSTWNPARRYLKGILIGLYLMGTSWLIVGPMSPLRQADASAFPGAVRNNKEISHAFCMHGDVMHQLLQGFGSERIAQEVLGSNINCEAQIITEEIIGTAAVLDVEIECECMDPEGEKVVLDNLKGEWRFRIEL